MTETEQFDAALDRILSDMTAEEVAMIPGVRGVLVQELYSVIVDEMGRSDDQWRASSESQGAMLLLWHWGIKNEGYDTSEQAEGQKDYMQVMQ